MAVITWPLEWNPTNTKPTIGGVDASVTPALFTGAGNPAGSTTERSQQNVRAGTHATKMMIRTIVGDNANEQLGWDMIGDPGDYPFDAIGSDVYYHCVLTIMPGFDWSSTAKTKSGRNYGRTLSRVSTRYFREDGICVAENDGASGGLAPAVPPDYNVSNSADTLTAINFDMNAYADGQPHEFIVRVKGNTTVGAASPTSADSHDAILQVWIDNSLIGTLTGWRLHNTSGNVLYENWWGEMISPYFQLGGSTAGLGGTMYVSEHFTNDTKSSLHDLSAPTGLVIT